MVDWLAVQTRLKELGIDPGPLDNEYGPLTRAAVREFQKQYNVQVRFPGTIDFNPAAKSNTLAALFDDEAKPTPDVQLPWMSVAKRKMGLHEVRNNSVLRRWLRSDGATLGDPAKLPWCGDFVETCIALTLQDEALPTNPYLALNWTKFGEPSEPTVGAVVVFWRGSPGSWKGHVGFLVGQSRTDYYVLGGNQRNTISIAPIEKRRTRRNGIRWPKTFDPLPIRLPRMSGGTRTVNEF